MVELVGRAKRYRGRSLFIWGPPGIGKSALVQAAAKKSGRAFFDLRLSQMAPEDIRGVPFKTKIHNRDFVLYSEPSALPHDIDYEVEMDIKARQTRVKFENPHGFTFRTGRHESGKPIYSDLPKITVESLTEGATASVSEITTNSFEVVLINDTTGQPTAGEVRWKAEAHAFGILALEEFNSAAPTVQTASYQLVLDRKVGDYVVPEDIQIIALGNRETDRGVTFKQPLPIANRFIHVELTSNGADLYKDWFDWAIEEKVHPYVVGYLEHYKASIFKFDPTTASRGFPTPRSWEMVSDLLLAANKISDARPLIYGSIGDAEAGQFVTYCDMADVLPKPEGILNGTVTDLSADAKRSGVALTYSVAVSLCYEMQARQQAFQKLEDKTQAEKLKKEWFKETNNALKFMLDNFQEEVIVVAIKMALQKYDLKLNAKEQPVFADFTKRFKPYILGGSLS
jgi:MoxR-like ATPase